MLIVPKASFIVSKNPAPRVPNSASRMSRVPSVYFSPDRETTLQVREFFHHTRTREEGKKASGISGVARFNLSS